MNLEEQKKPGFDENLDNQDQQKNDSENNSEIEEQNINENNKKSDEQKTDKNEQDSDIYGSPDTFDYSNIQLPEGMKLDNDLIKEFEPVAKKLNLSNKSANELMQLAVKLTEKNTSKFGEYAQAIQQAKKDSYQELLNTDKELDVNNTAKYEEYLDVAIQGLKAVATPGFKELLKAEGLTHHPEFIKTFHKIGELCVSEKMPNPQYSATQKELDAADILYGKKE